MYIVRALSIFQEKPVSSLHFVLWKATGITHVEEPLKIHVLCNGIANPFFPSKASRIHRYSSDVTIDATLRTSSSLSPPKDSGRHFEGSIKVHRIPTKSVDLEKIDLRNHHILMKNRQNAGFLLLYNNKADF